MEKKTHPDGMLRLLYVVTKVAIVLIHAGTRGIAAGVVVPAVAAKFVLDHRAAGVLAQHSGAHLHHLLDGVGGDGDVALFVGMEILGKQVGEAEPKGWVKPAVGGAAWRGRGGARVEVVEGYRSWVGGFEDEGVVDGTAEVLLALLVFFVWQGWGQ